MVSNISFCYLGKNIILGFKNIRRTTKHLFHSHCLGIWEYVNLNICETARVNLFDNSNVGLLTYFWSFGTWSFETLGLWNFGNWLLGNGGWIWKSTVLTFWRRRVPKNMKIRLIVFGNLEYGINIIKKTWNGILVIKQRN